MSPSASEQLLYEGVQAPFPGWTLVVASGRHAGRFLNSQLTSEVAGLDTGRSQTTALLDRAGRLQAFGFLCRHGDRYQLLLPSEVATAAVRRLEEYVVADDVSFDVAMTAQMRLVLGAEALRLLHRVGADRLFPIDILGSSGFVSWGEGELDLPVMSEGEIEARRVLTGQPLWGRDVTEGVLIHETTLIDSAVSATKGCYLGQETVAKVSSGRGAARAPMLLEVLTGGIDGTRLVGASFSSDIADRSGTVLYCARWEGSLFLQASLRRELRVAGREFEGRFEDGPTVTLKVHKLPSLTIPEPEEWARAIARRAVRAFAADREGEAIELYERAIAVCPSCADAYEALGVILGRHGRYEEAIELMQELLEVDPASVMAHTNLSLYYNQQGRIEDAEREAAEAMRAKMRHEAEEQQGDKVKRDDQGAAAADRKRRVEMFRQVLELDPDDPLGNFGLGELMVEEGRFDKAVDHLERALRTDPRYSAALLALGRAHEGANDLAAARETYRRGVDIAASRGDLSTANKMQERLAMLETSGD